MSRHIISFPIEGRRFNYRVAAIIIVDEHVLICDEDDDGYAMLPGGRVELGDPSKLSLEREIAEEIGLPGQVGDLLLMTESFYERDVEGLHEVGLFYRASLPADARPYGQSPWRVTHDEKHEHRFHWIALHGDGLETFNLKPAWLSEVLRRLPDQLTHIVFNERGDA